MSTVPKITPEQESEYITAAQARELGVGNAEWLQPFYKDWRVCDESCRYDMSLKYRAIKQTQPEPVGIHLSTNPENAKFVYAEPVDTHAAFRAEYIRQRDAVPCELGFYKWEYRRQETQRWSTIDAGLGSFFPDIFYKCTNISCFVSKDGEPAIRMLRTEAQELQRKLGDTVDWYKPNGELPWNQEDFSFLIDGTYTYRTKATIKLGGNMVTPEQAAAEWDAKRGTHDLWFCDYSNAYRLDSTCLKPDGSFYCYNNQSKYCYELRPKKLAWVGSRANVIALLRELGVL